MSIKSSVALLDFNMPSDLIISVQHNAAPADAHIFLNPTSETDSIGLKIEQFFSVSCPNRKTFPAIGFHNVAGYIYVIQWYKNGSHSPHIPWYTWSVEWKKEPQKCHIIISVTMVTRLFSRNGNALRTVLTKSCSTMTGKVVVISGASSGIGEELAILYAKKGAKLILSARRVEKLKRVAENCHGAGGVQVVACDVSVEEDCKHLISQSMEHYGSIDYLILNAGVGQVCRLLKY